MRNEKQIAYIKKTIADTISRAQLWVPASVIFATHDDLLVETLWQASEMPQIEFQSAYDSYNNYRITQKLSIADAIFFRKIHNILCNGWNYIKQGKTLAETQELLSPTFPENTSQELQELVFEYLSVCEENKDRIGTETVPSPRIQNKITKFVNARKQPSLQ